MTATKTINAKTLAKAWAKTPEASKLLADLARKCEARKLSFDKLMERAMAAFVGSTPALTTKWLKVEANGDALYEAVKAVLPPEAPKGRVVASVDHGPSNRRIAAMLAEEAAEKPAAKAKAKKESAAQARTQQGLDIIAQEAQKAGEASVKELAAQAAAAAAAEREAAKHTKASKELDNDITPACVCRERGTSYTCIRLTVGETHTYFVPMSSLKLEKAANRAFHDQWQEYRDYPVRRAAEMYLATPHRDIPDQARRLLEGIVRNPHTVYTIDATTNQLKDETMATAKKTAPAIPAKNAAPAPAAKKAAPSPAPAPAAAKKVAAKAAAPAPVPAKKAAVPAKQPAPAAKKAANGINTVVSGAKPSAKQAASVKPAPTRAVDTANYKVADASVERRGVTAEFQAAAIKLKTFTRQKLIDTMVAAGHDAAAARIKVADMVYFKILTPA